MVWMQTMLSLTRCPEVVKGLHHFRNHHPPISEGTPAVIALLQMQRGNVVHYLWSMANINGPTYGAWLPPADGMFLWHIITT